MIRIVLLFTVFSFVETVLSKTSEYEKRLTTLQASQCGPVTQLRSGQALPAHAG
jgi:hypothetical protein